MNDEFFVHANEALVIIDDKLNVQSANNFALKLIDEKLGQQDFVFNNQDQLQYNLREASGLGGWVPLQTSISNGDLTLKLDARIRRLRQTGSKRLFVIALEWKRQEREAFQLLRDEVNAAHARSRDLEEAKKRLANVIEGTKAGCWEFDLETQSFWLNSHGRELIGQSSEGETFDLSQWEQWGHPDELPNLRKLMAAHLRGDTNFIEFEARCRQKQGNWTWLANKGKVIEWNKRGEPVKMAGTLIDITQRKNYERELEEKCIQAEAANIAKSQFLAIMSHEIRTPMNGVLGMLNVVLNSTLDSHQRQNLEIANSSAYSLMRILDDILDFSKLEAGFVEIECKPFSPSEIVEHVANLLFPKAKEKELSFYVEKSSDLPAAILGDAVRLRQVLTNLISNAIKFTEIGGVEIFISLEQTPNADNMRIEVRDTGIGVSDEAMPRLFDKFAQADSTTTRKYGGTGLGLSISKQLVELMGGEIGVESEEGKGSTFWFTIPSRSIEQIDGLEFLSSDIKTSKSVMPDVPSMYVLVVDDNSANRELVRMLLAAAGHESIVVSNGQEALNALEKERFDVILMDIEMPDMDGISVFKEIRRRPGINQDTPVIALTAHAMPGDRERYLKLGMNKYVSKPIDPFQFAEALGRVALIEDIAQSGDRTDNVALKKRKSAIGTA